MTLWLSQTVPKILSAWVTRIEGSRCAAREVTGLGDLDGRLDVCFTTGNNHKVTNSPSQTVCLGDLDGRVEVCCTTGDNYNVTNSPSETVCLGD